MSETPPAITASIKQFKELAGFGVTTIYKLMDSGAIRSVKIGRRRFIILASWYELLDRSQVPANARRDPRATDGTIDGSRP